MDDLFEHADNCDCFECVFDDAVGACSQFVDAGFVVCGAFGSEWCDWSCPFSAAIGEPAHAKADGGGE